MAWKALQCDVLVMPAGQEDYVVDALALHDHLHLLRPLLADPAVLKVDSFAACYILTRHFLGGCGQHTISVQSCSALLQSCLSAHWKAWLQRGENKHKRLKKAIM